MIEIRGMNAETEGWMEGGMDERREEEVEGTRNGRTDETRGNGGKEG